MRRRLPKESFEDFETRLHSQLQEVERELLGEELARADVDVEAICVQGATFRRVLRAEQTYMTAAGPVRVERTLYKDRTDQGERAISPMELAIGVVGGFWTPVAAKQAAWVVSQMTPQSAEEWFTRLGHMTPSKSSLDRLPKEFAERWKEDRPGYEAPLREAMTIPEQAVTVMVVLDGVLAPMKDGGSVEKRAHTAAQGQIAKGPAGYREVGCATLAFCDERRRPASRPFASRECRSRRSPPQAAILVGAGMRRWRSGLTCEWSKSPTGQSTTGVLARRAAGGGRGRRLLPRGRAPRRRRGRRVRRRHP